MPEAAAADSMRQYAPWPADLADVVAHVEYRPGWVLDLQDMERDEAGKGRGAAGGLTLRVLTLGYDSYHPDRGEVYRVWHYFPVPAATYNRASWQRWVFDCLLRVETHEAMEFFQCGGARPYAATHGPGDDPYVVHDYATDTQRRTRFTGEVVAG